MAGFHVICLGEALVDRLGPLGGNPAIDQPTIDCLGGAPANVACGIAKLGLDVAFVGCLGNDSIGKKFFDLFHSRGINTSAVEMQDEFPTRVVLVHRDFAGERSFAGFSGNECNLFADQALNKDILKNALPSLFTDSKWLVLGTIPLAIDTSRECVQWSVREALNNGLDIAIDLNWRPTFWDSRLAPDSPPSSDISALVVSFLHQVSLLKLAKEEALWFFQTQDPRKISNSLISKPNVVITDGSNAIRWFIDDFVGETKVLSPDFIRDTTGAGDAFMSGLIFQFIRNNESYKTKSKVELMIQFAAACGALVCQGEGAIDPQPTHDDVLSLLSSYHV